MSEKKPDFASLDKKWPSSYVWRQESYKFSGGIINARTLANLDSKGIGPKGRIRIGRKIAYPVQSMIEWLEGRSEVVE